MGNINTAEFASHFTQKEIQKLYARFKQIDSDGSGDLDPREIFNVPELQQNPLVQRVISIFDINKDGKISEQEAGNDKEVASRFGMADADQDKQLSPEEIYAFLQKSLPMLRADNK